MNGLPYYKAYPRDFIEGTIGMPFEVKCGYRLVLDIIYMQGGKLPDDPRYISGLLGCSIRRWKGIRSQLLEMGKLQVSGEFLTNKRAVKELETLAKLQDSQRENGSRSKKTNGLEKPPLNQPEPEPEPEKKEDPYGSLSLPCPAEPVPADEISEAVNAYNETASASGWPRVQKLTPARRSALKARMGESGGIEGWRSALDKAAASDFLCGRSARGSPFLASFDFLTRQSSFAKLMEGNYDNRPDHRPGAQAAHGRPHRPDPALEQISRLAGLGAASGHGGG